MNALFLLLFSFFTISQPIEIVRDADAVIAFHVDGSLSAVEFDATEGVVLRTIANGSAAMLAAAGASSDMGDPVPALSASWKDAQGVQHTVTTPITGTTDAALQRSLALHNRIVAIMQAAHPPVNP